MLNILRSKYQQFARHNLHDISVTPRKNRSMRWLGIQHGELIDRIIELFKSEFSIEPHNEKYVVSPNEAVLLGGFELMQDGKPMQIPNLANASTYCFGVRHSNDSRFAVEGIAGGSVTICENGIAIGGDKWKHKHTTGFQLKDFILNGLKKFFERIKSISKIGEFFSETSFSTNKIDQILCSLARQQILPWRLLGEVDQLLNSPPPDYPFQSCTLWSCYNCITDIIKRIPPINQLDALWKAMKVVANAVSIPNELQPLLV